MPALTELQARTNQKIAVAVVYLAAMFIGIMDGSIVNVALPTIAREFRVAPTAVDGVSIAYLVSLAVVIPASGWLGDRFGGKRVLLLAIAIFSAASALCGTATSLGELVIFRVLQGIGGGMLSPVGTAMLFRAFPPQERVRASTIIVVPIALAPALAPVIGGLLVTDASWRWVFYVNVPIGVAALIYGSLFVQQRTEAGSGRFDLLGFLLSGVGLGSFMYGISEGPDLGWDSARVLTTIAAGVVLLIAMLWYELRIPAPLVALRLLGNRLFRSTTTVVVLVSVAFMGSLFAITLYFQEGRGMSALATGLSQFPTAIGVMIGSQLAGRLTYWRFGPRAHLALGSLGVAICLALLSLLGADTSLWWARVILLGMGCCLSQVLIAGQTASFATISPADTGRASPIFNAGQQLGGAIGVAILTSVVVAVGATHRVAGHVVPNLTAYHAAFLVAACFALLALPIALTVRDSDAAQTMVDPRRRAAAGAARS